MTDQAPRHVPVEALPDPSAYSYSHAIRAGSHVYLAGQCGTDDSGKVVDGGFEAQALRVLERLELAAIAAGGDRQSIVAMTVFITDIGLGQQFTQVRREFFRDNFPTSALIGVSALMPPGALVEAQAIAYIPEPAQG